ncbi:MAG: hypothetical protein JNK49_05930 [Planctomycetes bacterium]|nr:hypothetical protein [Planctomycetota bacterium]
MNPRPDPTATRESLRRLAIPHALAFGSRLLDRRKGDVITFREFVAVARELIQQVPDQTAVYLATLVALDMAKEETPDLRAALPSSN